MMATIPKQVRDRLIRGLEMLLGLLLSINTAIALPDLHQQHSQPTAEHVIIDATISRGLIYKNAPLHHPQFLMHSVLRIEEKNLTIEIDDTVRLVNDNTHQTRFLQIKEIAVEQATNQTLIRGWAMRSNNDFECMLPNERHELCFHFEVDEDDDRSPPLQGMQSISPDDITGKVSVIKTNKQYPAHASATGYVCRWMSIHKFATSTIRQRGGKPSEQAFIPVNEAVADVACFVPPWKLLKRFCGPAVATTDDFSAVDIPCGAGGASEGLRRAGIKVVRGVDICPNACATFRLNHRHAEVIQKELFSHIQDMKTGVDATLRPTMGHLSFVCKAASGLNTQVGIRDFNSRQGKIDEQNQAMLLSTAALLEAYRLQIVTAEQTNHILTLKERNGHWLRLFIGQFTSMGYAVRFRELDFADYGGPHRNRFILLGAAPGQSLPEFPPPTHGLGRPFPHKTIHDAIHMIRSHHSRHNLDTVMKREKAPYSMHSYLKNIITGNGTPAYHPSGKRDFTVRELACIAGLHHLYAFNPKQCNTETKKQIGNLVPADGFATIAKHLVKHLLQSNREYRMAERAANEARG